MSLPPCKRRGRTNTKGRFTAQRWRTLPELTPLGRVVRAKASGRYLTLSKVFPPLQGHAILLPGPGTGRLRRRYRAE